MLRPVLSFVFANYDQHSVMNMKKNTIASGFFHNVPEKVMSFPCKQP